MNSAFTVQLGYEIRPNTLPIGTIYFEFGELGKAEAAYYAAKAHTVHLGILDISRPAILHQSFSPRA